MSLKRLKFSSVLPIPLLLIALLRGPPLQVTVS